MSELLLLPPRSASVSDLLEAATRLFKATLPKVLPLVLIGVLCGEAANIVWLAARRPLTPMPHDPRYIMLQVVGGIIYVAFVAAAMLRQRALARGGDIVTSKALQQSLRRLPVLLLAVLLSAFSVAAGSMMLVLPGIFLAVCYSVLWPLVLFEGAGPYRALVQCVELVRPFWWKACACLVISLLVMAVWLLGFAAVFGILSQVLVDSAGFRAVEASAGLAVAAAVLVFLSSLWIVLYSAASSSA
jgi:hypothetical protein